MSQVTLGDVARIPRGKREVDQALELHREQMQTHEWLENWDFSVGAVDRWSTKRRPKAAVEAPSSPRQAEIGPVLAFRMQPCTSVGCRDLLVLTCHRHR